MDDEGAGLVRSLSFGVEGERLASHAPSALRRAIEFYEQYLAIAREIGDRGEKGQPCATWAMPTRIWATPAAPSSSMNEHWSFSARSVTGAMKVRHYGARARCSMDSVIVLRLLPKLKLLLRFGSRSKTLGLIRCASNWRRGAGTSNERTVTWTRLSSSQFHYILFAREGFADATAQASPLGNPGF